MRRPREHAKAFDCFRDLIGKAQVISSNAVRFFLGGPGGGPSVDEAISSTLVHNAGMSLPKEGDPPEHQPATDNGRAGPKDGKKPSPELKPDVDSLDREWH
jgi:hypothetical protein